MPISKNLKPFWTGLHGQRVRVPFRRKEQWDDVIVTGIDKKPEFHRYSIIRSTMGEIKSD